MRVSVGERGLVRMSADECGLVRVSASECIPGLERLPVATCHGGHPHAALSSAPLGKPGYDTDGCGGRPLDDGDRMAQPCL